MLNYATVGFLGLQALGLVLFLLDKGLQDDVLVNIAAACEGKELSLTAGQETYGKVLYALAFIGTYLGCLIESRLFNNNYPAEDIGP